VNRPKSPNTTNCAKEKKSYDVYDDTTQPILAKYDDEKPVEGVKVQLDTGQIVAPSTAQSPNPTATLPSAQPHSLEVTKTPASEYYSRDEMDAFKAQMQAEAHKKKKRKLRKKSSALSELLHDANVSESSRDLGSRTEREERLREQQQSEQQARLKQWQSYDRALDKAKEESTWLFGASSPSQKAPSASQTPNSEGGVSAANYDDVDNEDEEFYRALARARKLAAREERQHREQTSAPDTMSAATVSTPTPTLIGGGETGGELVFNDSIEFVRSLPLLSAADNTEDNNDQPKATSRTLRKAAVVAASSQEVKGMAKESLTPEADRDLKNEQPNRDTDTKPARSSQGEASEMEESSEREEPESTKSKRNEDEEEKMRLEKERAELEAALMGEETVPMRGVAGVLNLLRKSAATAQKTTESKTKPSKSLVTTALEQATLLGRATDKPGPRLDDEEDPLAGSRPDGIKKPLPRITIEHVDEKTGQRLTIKEAFRRLCYRFHNKPPSKNKQERRARQAAARFKQLTKGMTGENELVSVRHMQKVQRENKTPYVILGGSSKLFSSREHSDTKTPKSETSSQSSTTTAAASRPSSREGFKEVTASATTTTTESTSNPSRLKIAIELKRKDQ
jgi:hypothetical protein